MHYCRVIKSFHHFWFILPLFQVYVKLGWEGVRFRRICSHILCFAFRPKRRRTFQGTDSLRILNGVLKRNDFAAGRQNADCLSASVRRSCVCTCAAIPVRGRKCARESEREEGRQREKDRDPRGKSFTVKIPHIFQDDRLNAVLNEPRLF